MAEKILVVDDELQIAKTIRRTMLQANFEVAIAFDGATALTMLDDFAPDLVISDYRMPLMDGATLVREIRRRRPQTICILLSGYGAVDEISCDFIAKPFIPRMLVAAVRARLADRGMHAFV
jgi:two-component system response regulator HydG